MYDMRATWVRLIEAHDAEIAHLEKVQGVYFPNQDPEAARVAWIERLLAWRAELVVLLDKQSGAE